MDRELRTHKGITSEANIRTSRPVMPEETVIAARAYELWQERGCPIGSDQEDWFQAEQELTAEVERNQMLRAA
jgi:hypothetical protein